MRSTLVPLTVTRHGANNSLIFGQPEDREKWLAMTRYFMRLPQYGIWIALFTVTVLVWSGPRAYAESVADLLNGLTKDCPGCDLRHANLKRFDLEGGNLAGAILEGANLHGAKLGKVDLSGADLTRANLNKVDLRRAILVGATLTEAMLYEADVSAADLTGADLAGAVRELDAIETSFASRTAPHALNVLLTARLIAHAALAREESLGSHFREDFPGRSSGRPRHSALTLSRSVPGRIRTSMDDDGSPRPLPSREVG